ncbi:hypothetical protein [Robertmurraya sp.]|uniref:hypothetical protein n=1 Tax=Robertmurraya sp. TaxID=2837525 RepID=UPI0037049324
MEHEFEEYFQKKLEEDREMIEELHYTIDELRNIYRQEYEWKKNMPVLDLKLEPQPLDYDTVNYYLPEKWEMPREGKLLYSDEELLNVLKLIIYNLGAQKALDSIPRELLEQYLTKE